MFPFDDIIMAEDPKHYMDLFSNFIWEHKAKWGPDWLKTKNCHDANCFVTGALRWRHNESDGVSNHQPHHCLLNRLFKRR